MQDVRVCPEGCDFRVLLAGKQGQRRFCFLCGSELVNEILQVEPSLGTVKTFSRIMSVKHIYHSCAVCGRKLWKRKSEVDNRQRRLCGSCSSKINRHEHSRKVREVRKTPKIFEEDPRHLG